MTLRLAADLALPTEAVTQTFAILAKRGVGKTYTALVMVEEFLKARLPVVVVDPIGVCWGLRASADGKGPGLPIVVVGGDHADAPVEVTAGEVIANLVVEDHLSVVLDLSHFRKGEQVRFMTDFCERLYHKNREPVHVVLDEADAFAPQRPMRGQERMLGAVEDLVRRGRARGIGVTLVTQRAAVLNKDVLTQVEVLVALRTIAPQDRDAIDAWIRVHGTPEQREQLMSSLPSLPIGTAWFWSPGWLDVFTRVAVRRRTTFDSSATPTVGRTRQEPTYLAPVDLERLKSRIAATIARAKAEDPRELRRRIADLEQQLARPAAPVVERVEVPVMTPEALRAIGDAVRTVTAEAQQLRTSLEAAFTASVERIVQATAPLLATVGRLETLTSRPSSSGTTRPPSITAADPPRRLAEPRSRLSEGARGLTNGERRILTVLAQYPNGRTKSQVAILARYAVNGGGFNNYLSALRTRAWLAGRGDQLRITSAGLAALGSHDLLPTGRALLAQWLGQLGRAERTALTVLVDAFPRALTKDQIAGLAGYEANGGGFNNAISRLRTLELIEGRGELRASEALCA